MFVTFSGGEGGGRGAWNVDKCFVLRIYRDADKSLARPDSKNKRLKSRYFSSDAEVIAAAETWLDGQLCELFLSGLQKLEFGRCSLFPSWSD